jgi:glycosyltransferase involved in cell wall biosynthesis
MNTVGDIKPTPLVSVIVITFNSENHVVETLESVKNQTYANIELIISDDYSTDTTINLCEAWIDQNRHRFRKTYILKAERNRGVSENCNSAWPHAEGIWLKYIAGDDILLPHAIDSYTSFVNCNREINVVVAGLQFFGERNETLIFDKSFNRLSAPQQLKKLLLLGGAAIGPSGFFSKLALEKVGGFDTRCKMIEDYPLSLRFLCGGLKIYFLDNVCVRYRIKTGSISTDKNFSAKFWEMYELCAIPIIRDRQMYFILYHMRLRIMQNRTQHSDRLGIAMIRVLKLVDMIGLPSRFARLARYVFNPKHPV